MNWLKLGDTLILFSIRHLLRLQVGEMVILVYLRLCVEVIRKNWDLFHKHATGNYNTRLIR